VLYRASGPLDCDAPEAQLLAAQGTSFVEEREAELVPFAAMRLDALDDMSRDCDAVMIASERLGRRILFWNDMSKHEIFANDPLFDATDPKAVWIERVGSEWLVTVNGHTG